MSWKYLEDWEYRNEMFHYYLEDNLVNIAERFRRAIGWTFYRGDYENRLDRIYELLTIF